MWTSLSPAWPYIVSSILGNKEEYSLVSDRLKLSWVCWHVVNTAWSHSLLEGGWRRSHGEASFSRFPVTLENCGRKSRVSQRWQSRIQAKRSNAAAMMCDSIVLQLLVLLDLTAGWCLSVYHNERKGWSERRGTIANWTYKAELLSHSLSHAIQTCQRREHSRKVH